MKRLFMLLALVVMMGCQKEELTIIEEQQDAENTTALDAQLRGLVQSVASHDGSYDDVVDRSSCFSINFPYQVFFNGEPYPINSVADMIPMDENDEIIPMFPITITYTDHTSLEIESMADFLSEIDRCNADQIFNEKVTCVDLSYPIKLALYDPENTDFETLILDHDKLTFDSLRDIADNVILSLDYPLELVWDNGAVVEITDNEGLRSELLYAAGICN